MTIYKITVAYLSVIEMTTAFWIFDFIVLFLTFWLVLYFYFTRKFNHWKKKNVPYIPPIPFFGNTFKVFTFQENIAEFCRAVYESTTKPFIGFFIFDEPYLLIRDPELVKTVLVKDFQAFKDRSITNNPKDDSIGSNLLFLMKNPDWRDMRRKITPVFTSGKMKAMYPLICESGKEMVEYLKNAVKKDPVVDVREISAKYTTDAITSTSFGIEANCFKNDKSKFREVSRRIFNWAILERAISTVCYFIAPNLVKLFRLRFVDKESSDFLRSVFWSVMLQREKSQNTRNDLIDILIDLKNEQNFNDPYKLSGDKLVAPAVQFFVAGYETTSSTITFSLYELSLNKEIQNKLRTEIRDIISKHGKISYDSLKEMKYLDLCIKETLRKYPSLAFLDRRCNIDYQIPGTDIILERGSPIFVSNWGLQNDPNFFPEPEKYDPSRFAEENVNLRPQFAYLPFGEGPRICIGARFGIISSKSGLAHIISEFEVDLYRENQRVKLDTKGMLLAPVQGLSLRFKKI